ncbi:ArsB/NhaD family transporter, partial [Bacillus pumilus]|uniref:ArsB/NhaD family transporter n=1 Tax=Bacillus pumilus TaxID=1408 RepID=UPI003703AE68
VFFCLARTTPQLATKRLIKEPPSSILFFSIPIYVLLYPLNNLPLTQIFPASIHQPPSHPFLPATIFMPLLPPLLSSLINNLPTVLIDAISIG